ncbi:hypothetical protein BC826DRAFT_1188411 [Russula brevipes]|nr:hypothetical protein BC826DRAFT_1188411 [Russula brevipes]
MSPPVSVGIVRAIVAAVADFIPSRSRANLLGESLSTLRRLAACRRRYPFPPPLNPPSSWSIRRSQLSALISPSAAAQHPTVQPSPSPSSQPPPPRQSPTAAHAKPPEQRRSRGCESGIGTRGQCNPAEGAHDLSVQHITHDCKLCRVLRCWAGAGVAIALSRDARRPVVCGPAASESTAVLASARRRPLGSSGTSGSLRAGCAPGGPKLGIPYGFTGSRAGSPVGGVTACLLHAANVLTLDIGARLGPRVAVRALVSVKIDLPRSSSAAFGLQISAVWCPSHWALRTQAGGVGRSSMHGSGVHLALGCVSQRTVLWSGRAACFLVSGRLLRFPCLCGSPSAFVWGG